MKTIHQLRHPRPPKALPLSIHQITARSSGHIEVVLYQGVHAYSCVYAPGTVLNESRLFEDFRTDRKNWQPYTGN